MTVNILNKSCCDRVRDWGHCEQAARLSQGSNRDKSNQYLACSHLCMKLSKYRLLLTMPRFHVIIPWCVQHFIILCCLHIRCNNTIYTHYFHKKCCKTSIINNLLLFMRWQQKVRTIKAQTYWNGTWRSFWFCLLWTNIDDKIMYNLESLF